MKIPGGWTRRAACRNHPTPDLWFLTTDDGGPGFSGNRAAIVVCERCPVRRECLEYALDAREEHGIWGGTSERERRRIRRYRRQRTAA